MQIPIYLVVDSVCCFMAAYEMHLVQASVCCALTSKAFDLFSIKLEILNKSVSFILISISLIFQLILVSSHSFPFGINAPLLGGISLL